jgi:hypothetical protein
MKDVVAYHEVHAPLQWDILSVNISLSDVLKNPDLPWHYSSLAARLDLHQNSSIAYQINHGHRT